MMRFLYECKSILYCFILYSKNSVFPIQSSMNVFYAITICIEDFIYVSIVERIIVKHSTS